MTLLLKLILDIVKLCLYIRNYVPIVSNSKVIAKKDRQADRQLRMNLLPNLYFPQSENEN